MSKVGIDISYANNAYKPIDFKKLKKQVDFVIIRVGYRGYGDGKLHLDGWFKRNLEGCIANSIPFGVYFFTQAVTPEEAKEEALFTLEQIKGLALDYPIAIDTEESGHKQNNGRADKLSPLDRTDCIKAFCETVEEAGYYSMIYCSESWALNKLVRANLKAHDFWIALWNYQKRKPKVNFGMWQYSATGSLDGIGGTVDMNITDKNYPAIMKNNNLNGYTSGTDVWQVTIWGLTPDEYDEVCKWLAEKDFPHEDKVAREE